MTVIKTLPRDKQVIELMKKGIRFEMEKLRHYGALSLSLSLIFPLSFLSLFLSLSPPPSLSPVVVLTFDDVCMWLGRGKGERGPVLEDLQRCSLLVQGCWVVHSALLLTKESTSLRNARDYIVGLGNHFNVAVHSNF